MTLGNRAGQVIGIDEKEGVRKLYDLLDYDNGDEIVEEQYPESEYERDRTKEILPAPIQKPPVGLPGGQPVSDIQPQQPQTARPAAVKEALARVSRALKTIESRNGNAQHVDAR
jgi:hypothetical protein